MATTTTVHGPWSQVDRNGNVTTVYPDTYSEDVYVDNKGTTLDTKLNNLDESITQLNCKITRTSYTLKSTNYTDDNHYSFETDYPNESYNLTMEIDGDTASTDQINAFIAANFIGSNTSNIIKIGGTKPTIDIPVILEVEKK
jgi:hypothetical protein